MTTTEVVPARARDAHERMKAAQAERDELIRDAVAQGVSLRQIAKTIGISHQRVAQIVKDH
jgi:transposase-like protein